MTTYGTTLSTSEKLFGTTSLDSRQGEMIRRTYLLLSVAVVSAMAGGWYGMQSEALIRFFTSGVGFIAALLMLNVIPMVAHWAARAHPVVGLATLALDGLFSGLVLSPLLFIAAHVGGGVETIHTALAVTAGVFGSVSLYVFASGKQFSAPRGLMFGIFASIMVAVLVNTLWLQSGLLGALISAGVGLFGTFTLVFATSQILNDPDYNDPMGGALMLFGSLFNIFQAVLRLLMSFSSRD